MNKQQNNQPDEQMTGVCNACGEDLKPIYKNNGFTEPEGPSHWETTGFEPCHCALEIEEDNE